MNLELIGVAPATLMEAKVHASGTELVVPDPEHVQVLEQLSATGLLELETLTTTSSRLQQEIQQLAQEMKHLETKSATLHNQLSAHRAALETIEPVVQQRVIPPAIVAEICQGEIGAQWRAALVVAVHHDQQAHSEFSRGLLLKASNRIKEFYSAQVRRLRRPGVDAQSVQQSLILNASLYQHLSTRHPEIAQIMQQAYINTIKWYYQMLLEKYLRWIGRQPVLVADATKTIGETTFATRSFLASFRGEAEQPVNAFSVGARPSILSSTAVVMAWGTPAPPLGFHVEVLVHSLVTAMHDTIAMEHKVLSEGFQSQRTAQVLQDLFGNSINHCNLILDRLLQSWDVFDLLLSVRLFKAAEGPEIFEEFKQKQLHKLWAQIGAVLEKNTKSIESAVARPGATRKIGPEPHPLTSNVASMVTGILQLSPEVDPVSPQLRQLTSVYEAFATKLSKYSSAPELFLYNNYFLISALLGDVEGQVAKDLSQHFKLLYEAYAP